MQDTVNRVRSRSFLDWLYWTGGTSLEPSCWAFIANMLRASLDAICEPSEIA
jgi:hypothetical protein